MRPAQFSLLNLPSATLLLLAAFTNAQLPYLPTRLLKSASDDTLAYIFQRSVSNQFELASINLTHTINQALDVDLISSPLPFLDGDDAKTFVSAIDQSGTLLVYAGKCSDGVTGAELWSLSPIITERNGNRTWVRESLSGLNANPTQLAGPNYLASAITYSSVVGNLPNFYTFGGMCPEETEGQQGASWQGNANYSNQLITLAKEGTSAYELQITSTASKPIAEAGFSLTGLASTYSINSNETENMQQSFVLIGGHTETAFINMSQVALFSLPQGAWNFLPIEQPSAGHTDLTMRDESAAVEPRSGHSAVLSADGTQIVIFGGWLGSVDAAASPQLAVLNVGAGYGGTESWSWTVPDFASDQPPAVFGHDALLLDGNVMMITGGYNIHASSSRFRGRASDSLSPSTSTSFFNISSGTWMASYTPPDNGQTRGEDNSGDGQNGILSTTGEKIGLGIGLGLGVLAVICLLVFYLWYRRRLRRQREAREEEVDRMACGAHHFTGRGDNTSIPGSGYYGDGPYDEKALQSPSEAQNQQEWRSTSGHNVDIPSPTRGLRKSAASRSGYHAAPRYEEKRSSQASGHIAPIEESDEEHFGNSGAIGSLQAYHQKKRSTASAFSNATTLDPFMDPLRSHPTSILLPDQYEVSAHPAHQIVAQSLRKDLYADVKDTGGRVSPTKSDRTSSTLSEATSRSGISTRSLGTNAQQATLVGTLARNLSIRSSGLFNAIGLTATTVDPFRTPRESPTREREGYTDDMDRPRTKESEKTGSSRDNQSFYSAQSGGFDRLRAESEALLGNDTQMTRNVNTFGTVSYEDATTGQSPVRQDAVPTPKSATFAGGVFGSVRRALGGGVRRQSAGPRSASFTSRSPMFGMGPQSGNTSPKKANAAALQRSVSDAGAWKARRSGAQDWLGDKHRYGAWDDDDDTGQGDDWDVERAANERNVQVMFTVPRERLRVVNAEIDARSLLSSVDGEALEERFKADDGGKRDEYHATRTL